MSNASKEEPGITAFLLFVVLFGLCAFLWYNFRHPILEGMRWIRYVELLVLTPFSGDDIHACRHWASIVMFDDKQPTLDVARSTVACFGQEASQNIDYYGLNAVSMEAVARKIAPYYHWVLAAIFGICGIMIGGFSKHKKFFTKHNLESFIKAQAKMWPVISPIVNFNPAKASSRIPGTMVPDKIPPFAEAFSPEEWISWHRILVTNGIPDREATRRAFLLQLGPRWNGVDGQPDHVQALFAAFALKGAQRREESDALLGRISECWDIKTGLALTSEVRAEIKKVLRDKEVMDAALPIANQHAWRATALLGVLKWGRWMGGVLAPAQFLWLRAVDRPLWYVLNNLGRRSYLTEGAGAMAHFMAELNAKKPLPIPRIDTAIVTLNQYLASPNALPIPPREGNGAKSARA